MLVLACLACAGWISEDGFPVVNELFRTWLEGLFRWAGTEVCLVSVLSTAAAAFLGAAFVTALVLLETAVSVRFTHTHSSHSS